VPNNWDITTTGKNGKMVQLEGCFPIAAITPEIRAARAAEKKFKLTAGTPYPPRAWER
jgi:hypothetical protein